MSRVNKYRGIHIHVHPQNEHLNGTWIYGYLADENYINSPELEGEFLVDKDTIGQYIGVDDKNGKEIYEGDTVKHDISDTIGVVKWYCEDYIGWCVDDIQIGEQQFTDEMWNECEVIGNVYENADLLKEAGNE